MPGPDIGPVVVIGILVLCGILLAVALCCCCMYRRSIGWCCGCVYRCAKCCCVCVYRCVKWSCSCVYRCAKWCCSCVYRCAKWCCSCVYRCAKWCCCPVATSLERQTTNERQFTEVPDHVMRHTTIERFIVKMANEKPIRFTAEQLAGYTANYSAQLGRGGFGTVYKGALTNGLAVAVKVLHGELDQNTSEQQFMAEMETIGTTHHINLVRLYGYCFDGATHALVYEFMEHGALDAYLSARGPEGVSMATVAAIATGVARGLRYLHEECQRKIVHYDIKPGNVLLDGSLTPKVADFGLARLVSRTDTHVSLSRFRGTRGFAAPEVWNELRATEKCGNAIPNVI